MFDKKNFFIKKKYQTEVINNLDQYSLSFIKFLIILKN